MVTENRTLRTTSLELPVVPLDGTTLMDVCVRQNAGKWYVVSNPNLPDRYVVQIVDIGGGHAIPVNMNGKLFGGADPHFWQRFVVTKLLEPVLTY